MDAREKNYNEVFGITQEEISREKYLEKISGMSKEEKENSIPFKEIHTGKISKEFLDQEEEEIEEDVIYDSNGDEIEEEE